MFHHDGINGLELRPQFKEQLNARLRTSADQTFFVIKAFKNFQANYSQLTVNPPPPPGSPTLASLLAGLKNDVDFAVSHHQKPSNRPQPLVMRGLKASPLAMQSLVPFADAQIVQLGATLAATPPVPGPNGTTVVANPTPTINIAVNAILNALAEQSVHPNLFQMPSDFYISPNVYFTLDFVGAPAKSSLGFFVRGPHGTILPGAPIPPNYPT